MADVQKPKYVIGNATVMLAPYSEDVFALTPDDHSIGMVKSVTLEQQTDQIMLRNGIRQLTVDTVKSNVNMNTTFEGYEFDAKNLIYALGIAGSTTQRLRGTLDAQITTAATSFDVTSAPVVGDADSLIDDVGDIPQGASIIIQHPTQPDLVLVTAASAATTGTGPYTVTIPEVPAGMTFPAGSYVWIVNEIEAGSFNDDDFFCAKIVGYLSANQEPIVVTIPKLKITRGFNLSFSETDYSNMPFELSPIVMTRQEVTSRAATNSQYTGFDNTLARAYVGG